MKDSSLIEVTASIVRTYLENNQIEPAELPGIIAGVRAALVDMEPTTPRQEPASTPAPAQIEVKERQPTQEILPPTRKQLPAVPVEKSIHPDYITCLENGRRYKSMKQPLRRLFGLSPEQYRIKWGLPSDYPMVAPNYKKARQQIASAMGLGKAIR